MSIGLPYICVLYVLNMGFIPKCYISPVPKKVTLKGHSTDLVSFHNVRGQTIG